ncbi:MAG: uracil phosphoribosyltransferase [Candidatus Kapabacteria bacterium]|nr:uracil phosphoribosyltransferase [Candidatus Kapabacteria bacterium]MDW7997146.1 uracil phosphoribosyltransferase [Bacteroidota bacterium]
MVSTVVERQPGVWVVEHPAARHELAILRSVDTGRAEFRAAAERLGFYLAHAAAANLAVEPIEVETPLCRTIAYQRTQPLVLVPILRAGMLLLPAFLRLFPEARIGYLGLRRDERTLKPELYYANLPPLRPGAQVFVLDPMMATGGSMQTAVEFLCGWGATVLTAVCIIAAPEGIRRFRRNHPAIPIVTAAIDYGLNEQGFIIPGLGDAGDRAHGTGGEGEEAQP